jgi:pimeloyl-ACP methyl ester carboxylesterase
LPDGAFYEFSVPGNWNDLVIYARGYVNPQQELALPDDEVEGRPVSEIVNMLGMAYATTSFRANGLVGPEAVDDLVQLVNAFVEQHRQPRRIYLVGVSQGSMITTLAVEQHPDLFSGGLAGCGPIGDFRRQVNYLGDFHVLFNYFYPDLEIGNPTGVPGPVIENWLNESSLKQQVRNALTEQPGAARTLLRVARVPVQNETDPEEIEGTIFDLLRYNVLATNNAIDRLNGYPFDNSDRRYTGTGSPGEDETLNMEIDRFQADAFALENIDNEFETSGDLSRPLVTMHTTGDQEVPYWHVPDYREKVSRRLRHSNIRVSGRYGHCNFRLTEVLAGFAVLVLKVTLHDLIVPFSIFPDIQAEQEFLELSREQGANPVVRESISPQVRQY